MTGDKPLPRIPPLWVPLAELARWLQEMHGLTESEIRDVVLDLRGVSLWFRLLDGSPEEDENLESWNGLEVDWEAGRARWKQAPDSKYFPLVVSWEAVRGAVDRLRKRRERLKLQAPVATKADETTAAESQYPAIGEVPEHLHLTACEVLTWIGYGRAISKDVYLAPVVKSSGLATEERASLPHRSVPDPKPPEDPMDDAERKLMEAVRAGHVHILIEINGAFEEMPTAIYEAAVAVNARGSIEADWKAAERDRERAISYRSSLAPIGDVWFRKSEVLEAWPCRAPTSTWRRRRAASAGRAGWQSRPDASSPRRGRPGVREICLALFHDRRASGIPLQRPRLAEAREIVRDWPTKDVPPKPKPETVSERIAAVWIEAIKCADKL